MACKLIDAANDLHPQVLTIALPGVLGNAPMGHATQVLVVSILVTSHIRIPDLTALVTAAWIALHGQPSQWARLLRWSAYPCCGYRRS
jgi:hypothetical protein